MFAALTLRRAKRDKPDLAARLPQVSTALWMERSTHLDDEYAPRNANFVVRLG